MEFLICLVVGIKKKVIKKDKNINLHHKHLLHLVTYISESFAQDVCMSLTHCGWNIFCFVI